VRGLVNERKDPLEAVVGEEAVAVGGGTKCVVQSLGSRACGCGGVEVLDGPVRLKPVETRGGADGIRPLGSVDW
jgi:hypothetical protein